MAIFKRLVDIIKSNINDLLEKAEDPEKMIRLMVTEMEEAVVKSTSALAQAIASEKKLERQLESSQKSAESLQQKALVALKSGNEELSKRALNKKMQLDANTIQYQKMHASAKATAEELRSQLDKLKMKLDEAKMKEGMLIARSQNAKARAEIAKKVGSIGNNSFADFDRFEEKIVAMEAEADAFTELADEETSLEEDIAELEDKAKLDEEFEKLKKMLD